MREESALLAAIEAGDDTARLALADLLEEAGDPRAPWVREPRVFAWMQPGLRDPIPPLMEAANDGTSPRHSEALLALPLLGQAAVPALIRSIEAGHAYWAGRAIGGMKADDVAPVRARLMQLVTHSDLAISIPAAVALGSLGPGAAPAMPAFVRLLPNIGVEQSDEHREHWADLADLLGKIGPAARPAVPGLALMLSGAYQNAEAALVSIGPRAGVDLLDLVATLDEGVYILAANPLRTLAPDCLPELRRALWHDNSQVRAVAALALSPLDPEAAMPALVEALSARPGQDEYDDRQFAEAILEASAFVRPPIFELQAVLPELGSAARQAVAACLERLGESGGAMALLRERLSDADPNRRYRALATLACLNDIPEDAVAASVPLLDDAERFVRHEAGRVLAHAVTCGHNTLVAASLPTALANRHEDTVLWAMAELAKDRGPTNRGLLRGQLRARNPEVRNWALALLRGPDGGDVVPALLRLASDRIVSTRAAAVWAMADTGPLSSVAEAIRTALADPSPAVRTAALRSAATRGPAMAVGDIVRHLANHDRSKEVRRTAITALPHCGLPPRDAVETLLGRLEDRDNGTKAAAAHGLGLIAEQDTGAVAAAIPALLRLVRASLYQATDAAVWTLGRIGTAAVAGLAAVLDTGDIQAKIQACRALQHMGATGAPAAQAILPLLSAEQRYYREGAAHALALLAPVGMDSGPLRRVLYGQQSPDCIEYAITALVRMKATDAWPNVASLVSYEAGDVAAAVVWAARTLLPPDQARACWQVWLDAPLKAVRLAARYELWRLGEAEALATTEMFEAAQVMGIREEAAVELARRAPLDEETLTLLLAGAGRGKHGEHGTAVFALARVPHLRPRETAEALISAVDACSEVPFQRFVLDTLALLPTDALTGVATGIREWCESDDYLLAGPAFALLRRIAQGGTR